VEEGGGGIAYCIHILEREGMRESYQSYFLGKVIEKELVSYHNLL